MSGRQFAARTAPRSLAVTDAAIRAANAHKTITSNAAITRSDVKAQVERGRSRGGLRQGSQSGPQKPPLPDLQFPIDLQIPALLFQQVRRCRSGAVAIGAVCRSRRRCRRRRGWRSIPCCRCRAADASRIWGAVTRWTRLFGVSGCQNAAENSPARYLASDDQLHYKSGLRAARLGLAPSPR